MSSRLKLLLTTHFWAPVGVLGIAVSGLELLYLKPSHHNMNLAIGFTIASPLMAIHAVSIRPRNFFLCAVWVLNCGVYGFLARDSAKQLKVVREEQQKIALKYFK
ncbi:unnamed protein product [Moneuplotes crassus]|uniref:Mitochondrial pyruvate carrier n=1 Tax=Euplotes crassus TaxID=5936 RepID=A0AAD1Y6X8_EUPCR|nr:unnamed protein product [Moneuplotes crassus]